MSTLCGDEIQAWIDDQPDSHGVAHIQKKRKLAHPQALASKRPRRHLGIVDHNAVSQARSRSMAPARTTKLSSTVDQSSGSGSRPGRQKHSTQLKDDEVDPQQPSRARRSLRGGQRSEASVPAGQTIGMDTTQSSQSYAKLPASQQFDALRTLDTVASVSSAGDLYAAMLARNAASKKSARPQSPSKKSSASSSGQAMRLGKDKVDFRTLDKDNLPADAAMLFRKILHYSQGQRILPTSVDDAEIDPDDSLVDITKRYHENAPLSKSPPQETLDELVSRAARMVARTHSEAAWNCDVHAPFLRMALALSGKAHIVDLCNITTASLIDDDYCPRTFADQPFQQHKIDFAYTLQCPKLSEALARRDALPVNATNYDPVLVDPLAVLIETKLEKMDDAKRQLGVWAFAQFQRWLAVFGERPSFLPLLVFLKGKAYVCFAEHHVVDDHCGQSETIIYGERHVGDVVTNEGALRVLATLAELARWASDQLWPWMERKIS